MYHPTNLDLFVFKLKIVFCKFLNDLSALFLLMVINVFVDFSLLNLLNIQ